MNPTEAIRQALKPQVQHTPTPWIAELSTIYSLPLQKEKVENDGQWTDGSIVTSVINRADAAFIVRVVNAHEELVIRLRTLIASLESIDANIQRRPESFGGSRRSIENVIRNDIAIAKEAIAKAEGK